MVHTVKTFRGATDSLIYYYDKVHPNKESGRQIDPLELSAAHRSVLIPCLNLHAGFFFFS
jgi:hypothetical protein